MELNCGYCKGTYHLSCIIENPLWNKEAAAGNTAAAKRQKTGQYSESSDSLGMVITHACSSSDDGSSEVTLEKRREIRETKLHDKEYINVFLS